MIFPVEVTEHILITLFTCSKNNDLHCILAEFIHHIGDQVKALLVCQTGNDTNEHCIRILIESEITLELDLVFDFFFAEVLCVVFLGDTGICLRIEYIVINSINDTTEIMRSRTEKSIQTLSIEWCLDLLCISVTYCCYCICKDDTAL